MCIDPGHVSILQAAKWAVSYLPHSALYGVLNFWVKMYFYFLF